MLSDIPRPRAQAAILTALGRSPAVALIGPRQVGKTTLARKFVPPSSANYFDLEEPADASRLSEPMAALASLEGLVVIDEVQRQAGLFPALRVLIDRDPRPGRFLLLGSASPALLRQSGESLAGRLEVIEIDGLNLSEVGTSRLSELWVRGGFPRSFLAASDTDSAAWRDSFIRLTLERDLPAFGLNLPPLALRRLWTMVAHFHGQIWNAADPARSLGVSEPSVRRYLDVLSSAFLVRQLPPWYENLAKRQVKSPKVFIRDVGMLHSLLDVTTLDAVLAHPKSGASWEGFVVEQVLEHARPREAYFWATHQGAELDLLMFKHGRRVGVEAKRADAPRLTPSMRIAMEDLRLDELIVVYPGDKPYSLADRVTVVPATDVATFVA